MKSRFANRSMLFGAVLVILTILLGGAWLAEAKRGRRAPAGPPPAAADCKTDSDCVLVPDDCCSCNQGGKQRAIPKKDRTSYEKDRKKRCSGTMCTEMMSQDPSCTQRPFCGAGICELSG